MSCGNLTTGRFCKASGWREQDAHALSVNKKYGENNMFKKINWLIYKPLRWEPLSESENEKYFITDTYPKEKCFLRINDFPDEHLWTLFYNEDSISFNDTPILWKINYRD